MPTRFLILLALAATAAAQQAIVATVPPTKAAAAAAATPPPDLAELRSTYLLGPDDQIVIHALDAEELAEKPVRIDMTGHIRLPLAGRIKASGLTAEQLETEITARLKQYIKQPEISVSVVEFRSQPVSIIGSVKTPGVQQLQGRKTLVEMLSVAGGISEDAGHTVKITRRLDWGRIPLPNAVDDPTGKFSIASVNLDQIMAAKNPAENIMICPEDVISVPRADMVYVVGTVPKAGGYVLHERENLSVLQALSLAGGLGPYAAPQNAQILRQVPGTTTRTEIPVNLKMVLASKSADVVLLPDDILLVPSSSSKKALGRLGEAAIQLSTLAVYRF